jgi:hypothetical protein
VDLFSAAFVVRSSSSGTQWMSERIRRPIWSLIYSYILEVVLSFCPSFVLVYVFLEIYQMGNTLLSVFIRKIC